MAHLPDDSPQEWLELARQSPGMRARYDPRYALAEPERNGVVGLSDAALFPGQRFDAPPALAAPPPQGEEVDLVERARLNAVDQFYRGTSQGAITLRALAARAEGPDDPESDTVARAEQGMFGSGVLSRDQTRSEYRKIVADLEKYDRILPSASLAEYGFAGAGQIAGAVPTPENLAGLLGRSAMLAGRVVLAGIRTAGLNVATDPVVQTLSIGSKVQEQYDWVRTAGAAPIGFVVGAGARALLSTGLRSRPSPHAQVTVRLVYGDEKAIAANPKIIEARDLLFSMLEQRNQPLPTGRGRFSGNEAHIQYGNEIKALGRPEFLVEKSFKNGVPAKHGSKGSIRPDIILNDTVVIVDNELKALAVFDLKTGREGLDARRIRELQETVGNLNVPVFELGYRMPTDVP